MLRLGNFHGVAAGPQGKDLQLKASRRALMLSQSEQPLLHYHSTVQLLRQL